MNQIKGYVIRTTNSDNNDLYLYDLSGSNNNNLFWGVLDISSEYLVIKDTKYDLIRFYEDNIMDNVFDNKGSIYIEKITSDTMIIKVENVFDLKESTKDTNKCDYSRLRFGNVFKFGKLQGKDIYWRVIHKYDDNSLYVLSNEHIVTRKFDTFSAKWETSELRLWLNEILYNEIFNENEKRLIKKVNGDKLTLLTCAEAHIYMTESERSLSNIGRVDWWLRSSTDCDVNAQVYCVNPNGSICANTDPLSYTCMGVRPAFVLDFNKK